MDLPMMPGLVGDVGAPVDVTMSADLVGAIDALSDEEFAQLASEAGQVEPGASPSPEELEPTPEDLEVEEDDPVVDEMGEGVPLSEALAPEDSGEPEDETDTSPEETAPEAEAEPTLPIGEVITTIAGLGNEANMMLTKLGTIEQTGNKSDAGSVDVEGARTALEDALEIINQAQADAEVAGESDDVDGADSALKAARDAFASASDEFDAVYQEAQEIASSITEEEPDPWAIWADQNV